MKPIYLLGVSLASFTLQAQILNQSTSNASPTHYVVGQQDGNSQVWQQTSQNVNAQGNTGYQTNQAYVELATGLNHLVNGQWVASKEEIDISPDGSSAAATNGQHQVYFPGDIYNGEIKLVTPDGQTLESQPIGLSYFDGSNSVLLATVTNSTGAILPSGNQVIFANAFSGLDADLLYTYTKASFEQDIILRQQPPDPASLGLNPQTTRLQVLTEFLSAPQPSVTATTAPTVAGNLEDDYLSFGVMQMGHGKAFLIGSSQPSADVDKQWLMINGRQFLVEEVPLVSIGSDIDSLPPFVSQVGTGRKFAISKNLILPPKRLTRATPRTTLISRAEPPKQGLILDYVTMVSQTNWTFRSDATYFISGSVNLSGTNTFEGGTVLKYATNSSLNLGYQSVLNWQGGAYRPVILTAKDDDSVGEGISGSTGHPTNFYANPALNFTLTSTSAISGFRIAWAQEAVNDYESQLTFRDGQLVNCSIGFVSIYKNIYLRNALFAGVQTNFNSISYGTIDVQNSTFAGSHYLSAGLAFANLSLENCVLANVTNLTNNSDVFASFAGTNDGFYNCPEFGANAVTNTFYPFQSAGAGNYYLTNGCAFTNAGTVNIDSALLADLQQKTTQPPLIYSNQTISLSSTFSPQAQRDTDTPDLGYHYDPIDYIVDYFTVNDAGLLLTNGVVLASYNEAGIRLLDGSTIISIGTPLEPNWLVRYQSVQEQPISLGMNGYGPGGGVDVSPSYTNSLPNGQYRFTKFACPAGGGVHLDDYANSSYSTLAVQDCEFWSGTNYFSGTNGSTATLRNNLFARSVINASGNGSLALSNNLAWGVASVQLNSSGSNLWSAYNNDFDSSTVSSTNVTNGFNAYLNCSGRLTPTNANDIVSSNSLTYQTGPLGTFYQPTNSSLIHMGSTMADKTGLDHYTVTTNQVVEGTNTVSIGYHYIALDQSGNPLDTDGDGIPDYIEDANGDGVYDSGDPSDWTDFYNGTLPVLTVAPGIVQFGHHRDITPLAVIIKDTFGNLLTNAPLTFNVTQGSALLSLTTNGMATVSLSIRSDVNGQALVYFIPTNGNNLFLGSTNIIISTAVSGSNTTELTFTETSLSPTISAGDDFALILKPGIAWGIGDNSLGQLGNIGTNFSSAPVVLNGGITSVVQMAAGSWGSYTVDENGNLADWGTSAYGALGFPDELSNVVAASGSGYHAVASETNGTVWEWGWSAGSLNGYSYYAIQVTNITSAIAANAGPNYGLALLTNGTVWAWGDNSYGQFGDGGVMPGQYDPVEVTGLTEIVQISSGPNFCLALQSNGVVWLWGQTSPYPEAGIPVGDPLQDGPIVTPQTNGLANIIEISAGDYNSLALAADGKLWAWGDNDDGELGIGYNSDGTNQPMQVLTTTTNIIAIAAARSSAGDGATSFALDANGNVWWWGQWFDGSYATNVPTIICNVSNSPSSYAPTVNITSPTNGASLDSANITAEVTALDSDGFVHIVNLFCNGHLVDSVTNDNPVFFGQFTLHFGIDLQDIPIGTAIFLAEAVDNDGLTAVSQPVQVTVLLDTDGDGIPDVTEILMGTNPTNPDTDGDGVPDGQDAFPLDPTRSTIPGPTPGDITPPTISLDEPANATLLP